MRNIAFVIWMLGWPLAIDVSRSLSAMRGEALTTTPDDALSWVVIIWIFVAGMLYEGKPKKEI